MSGAETARSVLVTGAGGYVGRQLVAALAAERGDIATRVALDVRETPPAQRCAGVVYRTADVREPGLADIPREHGADTVVHLAAIVTPGPKGLDSDGVFEHSVRERGLG